LHEQAIINGQKYTGHVLDRMQDRGFMPSGIENTLKTGSVYSADFPGGLEYYDPVNKIKVVVGENGQIITIIPGRG
jgi:filamentous hemagglutinin